MHQITPLECSRIAQDLQIRKVQVESVVQMLDDGNTVPFITRYRKERTGGLHEEIIRQIQVRIGFLRSLADRKQTILKSIENQGKLTEDLRHAILSADTIKRLEDLYLPYKPKKKSLATAAREKGLEPLALAIWNRDPAVGNLEELWTTLLNPEKGLNTVDDVKLGVGHILAELIAETVDVRAALRHMLWDIAQVVSTKSEKLPEGQGLEFKDYFEFKESARQIPAHRILALNRGEKDNALKVHLDYNRDLAREVGLKALADASMARFQPPPPVETSAAETPPEGASEGIVPTLPQPISENVGEVLIEGFEFRTPHAGLLRSAEEDALTRLVLPSLEREIRNELSDEAESHAVAVFARNLRSLLLQPPLRDRRVLAIDPGLRTGCKLAALDEFGGLLEQSVMYPFGSPHKRGPRDKKHAPQATAESPAAEAPSADATHTETPPAEGAPSEAAPAEAPQELAMTETPSAVEAPVTESPPVAETSASETAASEAPAADSPVAETPAETPTTESPAPEAPAAETAPAAPEAPPVDKKLEARNLLKELIQKHNAQVVAIGNGTGCRETEEIVADLIATDLPDLSYVVVNEAGASVYSVSPVGREEFPNFDSTVRGTISIGRRLQDPLSELVKVDPPSIGVGLYQHDISKKELKESLDAVVESCVNSVGVDLNTASVPLLRHVSGLNNMVARELVEYRQKNGAFVSREQLLQIPGMGPQRFTQAAGFLKVPQGANPLDRTWIHPESYPVAEKILSELGFAPAVLDDKAAQEDLRAKLAGLKPDELAAKLEVGAPTVVDILQALSRPGLDPREDLPPPIFKKGILKLDDLSAGMELKGTVLNVVDFGAFVDIGLKDSGLVHISEMANRYIKSPYDVVAVSDVVTVWVKGVDKDRHRVSLTMIQPGTERKPPERRPAPSRDGGARSRPPRRQDERRPEGSEQPVGAGQGGPPHDRREGGGGDRGRRPQRGRGRRPGPNEAAASAPPPPPPPPRKPRREPPKAKLSQEALEGKAPLRTFSELSALFAVKKKEPAPAAETPPAAPVEKPAPENPEKTE